MKTTNKQIRQSDIALVLLKLVHESATHLEHKVGDQTDETQRLCNAILSGVTCVIRMLEVAVLTQEEGELSARSIRE